MKLTVREVSGAPVVGEKGAGAGLGQGAVDGEAERGGVGGDLRRDVPLHPHAEQVAAAVHDHHDGVVGRVRRRRPVEQRLHLPGRQLAGVRVDGRGRQNPRKDLIPRVGSDRVGGRNVEKLVPARPADQRVRRRIGVQRVLPRAADERGGAGAGDDFVGAGAADDRRWTAAGADHVGAAACLDGGRLQDRVVHRRHAAVGHGDGNALHRGRGVAGHRPLGVAHDQIAVRGVEGDVDGLPSRPAHDGQHAVAQNGGDGRNGTRLQLFQLQSREPRPAAEGRAGAEEVEQAHRASFRGLGEDEGPAHGRALSDEPGPNDCPLQSAQSARILTPIRKVHGFSDGAPGGRRLGADGTTGKSCPTLTNGRVVGRY